MKGPGLTLQPCSVLRLLPFFLLGLLLLLKCIFYTGSGRNYWSILLFLLLVRQIEELLLTTPTTIVTAPT